MSASRAAIWWCRPPVRVRGSSTDLPLLGAGWSTVAADLGFRPRFFPVYLGFSAVGRDRSGHDCERLGFEHARRQCRTESEAERNSEGTGRDSPAGPLAGGDSPACAGAACAAVPGAASAPARRAPAWALRMSGASGTPGRSLMMRKRSTSSAMRSERSSVRNSSGVSAWNCSR